MNIFTRGYNMNLIIFINNKLKRVYCFFATCFRKIKASSLLRVTLAYPGGNPPPNRRGPMIFYAPNAIFSFFCSLCSRYSFLNTHRVRTCLNITSTVNTFNDISNTPTPVDKVHDPPRSNPGSATVLRYLNTYNFMIFIVNYNNNLQTNGHISTSRFKNVYCDKSC